MERLQTLVLRVLAMGLRCRLQLPITLSESSEPEPDVAIVRPTTADATVRHPGASDVIAVVEVADSSLQYDRSIKQRLYAAAGIPVYWIVNIPERRIEIYSLPETRTGRYSQRVDVSADGVTQLDLSDCGAIDVRASDLLPESHGSA
jgi:Uma2 family endonuclease